MFGIDFSIVENFVKRWLQIISFPYFLNSRYHSKLLKHIIMFHPTADIRCFHCLHWCWKNVNKRHKATYQNHRQTHRYQMAVKHLQIIVKRGMSSLRIYKHSSSYCKRKIVRFYRITQNWMGWWVDFIKTEGAKISTTQNRKKKRKETTYKI